MDIDDNSEIFGFGSLGFGGLSRRPKDLTQLKTVMCSHGEMRFLKPGCPHLDFALMRRVRSLSLDSILQQCRTI